MRNQLLLLCLVFLLGCEAQETRIKGVSFVASRDNVDQSHIDPLVALQANHAAVMPFGFIRSLDDPEIIYNSDRQWFGETTEGVKQYIEHLHNNNIKVMLKPHIWIRQGEFTGYMKMTTEADWKKLETAYRDFILDFAGSAEDSGVEIFCIGTELEQFVLNRPAYWKELIKDIRKIYTGKLTYAANWDEYKRVPFWDHLDYIGVDAYFPVTPSKNPLVEEAGRGWKQWKAEMSEVAAGHNRKVLFTEYGYRSMDYAGKEPWRSDGRENTVNLEAQANLLTALYEEVWNEPWFAGGYVWKWFTEHQRSGGHENNQFTPQNKPAELVIKDHYSSE